MIGVASTEKHSADSRELLGGVWSDLTAQFEFLGRDGGFEVVRHDLHVL